MSLPDSLPITQEDWNNTPPAVTALISVLWEEISALRKQVATLQEQVGQNSKNSSRPPSSDPPSIPKAKRMPSGRKRGGQLGHQGVTRPLKPLEEVKAVIPLKPQTCLKCGHHLQGTDPTPHRHQVTEIPPIVAETVEYQLHTLQCPACDTRTRAQWPLGVPTGGFGPRVAAMVAALSGQYHISKRQIEELLADFFGIEISLGTVHALEQSVSEALEKPVAELAAAIKEQPMANVDETSFREANQRNWLWVVVTPIATMFLLRLSRGAEVVKDLLNETFSGIVGSDRWSGYNWIPPTQRQVCWAHLLRDFEAFLCRGGVSQRIGQNLLFEAQKMFHLWHRVRDGTLSRPSFATAMTAIKQQVGELLRKGAECDHSKTKNTCRNLLKLEEALWTFVSVEGIEPTNNAAERAVRSGVLWRKCSFGTQSEAGSRFVERMMTTVATLKQHKRNVLDYLIAALSAKIRDENIPSLLPNTTSPGQIIV